MAINPLTFDDKNNTAKNDGTLYGILLPDGILTGCALTYTSTTITVGAGYFIARGRIVQISSAETIVLADPISNGYVRLRAMLDLSEPLTPVSFEYDYSGTDSFAALTQEDINGSGTVYEVDFARATLSGGNVTGVTAKLSQLANLTVADIINNLTSTNTDKPLSAAQGKTLQDSTVKLSGNQAVSGVKTFSDYIVITGYPRSQGVYDHTTALSANMYIDGSGTSYAYYRSTSVRAAKMDIRDISEADAEKAYELMPRIFKGINKDTDDFDMYGLIADEVEAVLPKLCTYADGELNGIMYDRITALLLKQNQMQRKKIDTLTLLLVSKGVITKDEAVNL